VIPFFRIMCIAAILQPITNAAGWLYISRGKTKRMFAWGIATTPVTITFFAVGAYFGGAIGVAWGFTLASILLTIPCVWCAQLGTSIGTRSVLRVAARPFFASISAALATHAFMAHAWRPVSPPLTETVLDSYALIPHISSTLISLGVFGLLYVFCNCLYALSLAPIKDVIVLVRKHLGRRRL
jgi:hypothetical protein